MRLFMVIIFSLLVCSSSYAGCSQVPQSVRDGYALEMYQAFITQSYGKSTVAFYQFDVAREKAKKAGENPLRLIAMENLFAWYRMYASSLGLYRQRPTGNDRIIGEYRPANALCSLALGAYDVGGNPNPEKERLIREFLFGVGEVIAGVFCAAVSEGALFHLGYGTALTGLSHIYSSLNSLWATHQTELIQLKKWENNSLKPVGNL